MTITIVAKNTAQSISGSVNSTGSVVVLAGVPQVAYTVPAGKRAKVHVTALVDLLIPAQNLRFRIAGALIVQRGTNETIGFSVPKAFMDLGEWNLNPGDTVQVTTSNVGTEGGTCTYTAAVLLEIPVPP